MALLTWILLFAACLVGWAGPGVVMSVRGPVPADSLKRVLVHEHIVTNFIGAAAVLPGPGADSQAIARILPQLQLLRSRGISTLVECTPNFIGRDVRLLRRLSELSGLTILTNTGLYAAVDKKYLPGYAFKESREALAARWLKEWEEGIDGTGIRPAFIKLGVDKGLLDSLEARLLEAAILVSKRTRLPIYVHSGDGQAALDELRIVQAAQLEADRLVWVHAQNGTNEERARLAAAGAWVSLDGVSVARLNEYVDMILYLREKKLLHRLLISHDDGWGVPENGSYRLLEPFGNAQPYSTINTLLVPRLLEKGCTPQEVEQLLQNNPRILFGN